MKDLLRSLNPSGISVPESRPQVTPWGELSGLLFDDRAASLDSKFLAAQSGCIGWLATHVGHMPESRPHSLR
jgi:hypothetical protein